MAGVLAGALALTALVSHVVGSWLGVGFEPISHGVVGRSDRPHVRVYGSSLTLFGLDYEKLGQTLDRSVAGTFVPRGSPCEIEVLLDSQPDDGTPLWLGVSLFDLNENVVADHRAALVPMARTLQDLAQAPVAWTLKKRIVSGYVALPFARIFPTAGKSIAVMTGLRRRARGLLHASRDEGDADAALTLDLARVPATAESIADWTAATRLRVLGNYRTTGIDRHEFRGPKWRALQRLSERYGARLTVIVFPLSPLYEAEFDPGGHARARLVELLDGLERAGQGTHFVRLDRLPALANNAAYYDPVHLNAPGRSLATRAVLSDLVKAP